MASPPSKRRSPPSPQTRDRIVAGARRWFFSRGLRGFSVDELAEQIGVSKKTLYVYFRSKRELVEAVLAAKMAEAEAELARATAESEGGFEGTLGRLLAGMQRQMAEIQPAFVRDIAREEPELFDFVRKRRQALIQRHWGKFLQDGRRAGLVRRDVPVRVVLEVLLALVEGIINPRKLEELDLAPAQALNALTTIVLQGALTEKGRNHP